MWSNCSSKWNMLLFLSQLSSKCFSAFNSDLIDGTKVRCINFGNFIFLIARNQSTKESNVCEVTGNPPYDGVENSKLKWKESRRNVVHKKGKKRSEFGLNAEVQNPDVECTRDRGPLLFPNQCTVYSSWVIAPICIGKEHSTQLRDSYIYIKWQVDWTQAKDTRLWEIAPIKDYIKKMISRALSCRLFITLSLLGMCQWWVTCRLVFFIDFSVHQREKCELFHFLGSFSGIYYSKSISNMLKSHSHPRQFCKYSTNLWFKLKSKKLLGCLLSACHPVREMRWGVPKN